MLTFSTSTSLTMLALPWGGETKRKTQMCPFVEEDQTGSNFI